MKYDGVMEGPRRIVCLTDETTEWLYLLGEQERIVGVSGFTTRPREARLKPRVSAFTSAKTDKILALEPDLVLGFSNLQAEIASTLIKAGLNVMIFNQRSVEDIFSMMMTLARIVNAETKGRSLVTEMAYNLERIAAAGRAFSWRPRVFFEEWMDPLISGIRWVEELVEIAGGGPVFPELRFEHDAAKRITTQEAVLESKPDVVLASWCGRKVNVEAIRRRPGWEKLAVFEIKSALILQPGPAALTEGVERIHAVLASLQPGSERFR